MKYKRWGKNDDKILFKIINQLIDSQAISHNFIQNVAEGQHIDIDNDLITIKTAVGWKNSTDDLKRKIQKISKP